MCFGDEGGMVVVGERRGDTAAAYRFLTALSPYFDFYTEQCSEKCSRAENSVKFILFRLFLNKLKLYSDVLYVFLLDFAHVCSLPQVWLS